MSKRKSGDNHAALKDLLASWGLEELFQYLRDQEINIQELEMMKLHHLNELLGNFKLGIRIRFEHHFEKWRHSIFKPLEKCVSIQPIKTVHHDVPNSDAEVRTVEPQQTQKSSEPIIPPLYLPSKQHGDKADAIIPRRALKRNSTEIDDNSDSQITVLKILRSFGRQGFSLMDSYKQNQSFSSSQRQMLIYLIVNYFDINDYHLSLNTSHILEKQIVKYFPNEKVEYYRTEKRGKIYSKYSNMKRKRAEITPVVKDLLKAKVTSLAEQEISLESLNTNNNGDNEQEMDLCDDSSEPDFSDVPIKLEYVCN